MYFPMPFRLTEFEDQVVQTRRFVSSQNPLRHETLEKMVLRTNKYRETIDIYQENDETRKKVESNRKGIVAELLAIDLFSEHMSRYFTQNNPLFEGTLITGKEGYNINSTQRYCAKLITENRIVILKKPKDFVEDNKFGYQNIAEIDGLYMIKKHHTEEDKTIKKEKRLVVIETKSSDIRINPIHLHENILKRLEKMYKNPISYLVVGFKEDMYIDEQLNILNPHLKDIYHILKNEGHEFGVIHFPFKKEEFYAFFRAYEDLRNGIHAGKWQYNKDNSKLKLLYPNGEVVSGTFILDK